MMKYHDLRCRVKPQFRFIIKQLAGNVRLKGIS